METTDIYIKRTELYCLSIYGGKIVRDCLLKPFESIIKTEHILQRFKNDLKITLYKGAGKSQLNPDNYRAISLLPAVAKLFEKIICK